MAGDRHAAGYGYSIDNCYVRILGYQYIADRTIINCLIVINEMNDFVMLFHRMCRFLGFSKSEISLGLSGFLLLSCFSECKGCQMKSLTENQTKI